MKEFVFGTSIIPYTLLRRTDITSVTISVEFENGVEIVAPHDLSEQAIERVIRQKAGWITQKLKATETIESSPRRREFVSGEKYSYLGRGYTLVVLERDETHSRLIMRSGIFEASIQSNMKIGDRQELIRNMFRTWYKKRAENKLTEQAQLYGAQFNLEPLAIKVMDLDSRWGSCTPSRTIHLNWRIVMAPIRIIDYLVAHELCHLHVLDHSQAFWNMLSSVVPDYKERREWLRINGPTLTV